MDIKDFKPGIRVYIKQGQQKILGTVGRTMGSQEDKIVKFDNGKMVFITEKCAHLFTLEPQN